MRKIKRRKNYTKYLIITTICVFSCMGIGYSYLQENLNINMSLSKKRIDITDNVVASGDGVYEDKYESGRYIYRGSNPNNYIEFNDELWRIIAKETDGTYKIIRDELLPQNDGYTKMSYDEAYHRSTENNTYCTNSNWGCGVFAAVSGTFQTPNGNYRGTVTEDSSIKEYLNNTYYPTLNGTAKIQVQSHIFNIGSVQYLDKSGNDSIEKNIAGEKMYQWTGNVGLVNVSDLLRASTNTACESATDQYKQLSADTSKETCSSYLIELSNQMVYWTINAFSAESGNYASNAWGAALLEDKVGFVYYNTHYGKNYGTGVRPVIFLKPSIHFISGNGTKSNPYIIE